MSGINRRLLSNLLDLIEIPSHTIEGRRKISEMVATKLDTMGMQVRILGGKDNPVVCAHNGLGGVAFSGHLDTVPPGENWTREWGEVEDDMIFGRGAADMKGAVSVMMHTARLLVQEEVPFSLLFTTDEEELMGGAEVLRKRPELREASAVIIGEPTELKVAWKGKGITRVMLRTEGRAAHASMPWLGDNAIIRMHRILDLLEPILRNENETDEMTVCVSTIRGGVRTNIVPESCELEMNIRFPPSMSPGDVPAMILEKLKGERCDMKVDYELPAFQIDPGSSFVKDVVELAGTELMAVPYATEAALYASVHDTVVICGPGSPSQAHATDECVDGRQLERAGDLYRELAKRYQG